MNQPAELSGIERAIARQKALEEAERNLHSEQRDAPPPAGIARSIANDAARAFHLAGFEPLPPDRRTLTGCYVSAAPPDGRSRCLRGSQRARLSLPLVNQQTCCIALTGALYDTPSSLLVSAVRRERSPGALPMLSARARHIRNQCAASRVPFFKQAAVRLVREWGCVNQKGATGQNGRKISR
jgi:hypothetical protein